MSVTSTRSSGCSWESQRAPRAAPSPPGAGRRAYVPGVGSVDHELHEVPRSPRPPCSRERAEHRGLLRRCLSRAPRRGQTLCALFAGGPLGRHLAHRPFGDLRRVEHLPTLHHQVMRNTRLRPEKARREFAGPWSLAVLPVCRSNPRPGLGRSRVCGSNPEAPVRASPALLPGRKAGRARP